MIKSLHIRVSLISVILLLTGTVLPAQKRVIHGKANLEYYKFQEKNAELKGDWAFIWHDFIPPGNFTAFDDTENFFPVPALWNGKVIDGKVRNGYGFASYFTEVSVNDTIKYMALRVKRFDSSYKLFIDDSLYIRAGEPGTNIFSTTPKRRTEYIVFPVKHGKFTITIHISNFHHRKGGISDVPIVGFPHVVEREMFKSRSFEAFLLGALLIMAFYHLGMFFLRKTEYSTLFFGLLTIAVLLHQMANGEVLMTQIIPNFSWESLSKLDYLSNYGQLAFFVLFFYSLFKDMMSLKVIKAIMIYTAVMVLLVLITPARIYTQTLIAYEILASISVIYILYGQISAILKKVSGAWIPFLGTVILFMSAIHDILYEMRIIDSRYLIPFGIFVFIFFQSYILSHNFSVLFKRNEKLNKQLRKLDEIKSLFMQKSGFDIKKLMRTMVNRLNATRGLIISADGTNHEIKDGFPEKFAESYNYPESLIDKIISEKKDVIIADRKRVEGLLSFEYGQKHLPKSVMAVPIQVKQAVRYVVYLENLYENNAFTTNEVELLNVLSGQIAGLIANFDIYNTLESMNAGLEQLIEKRTEEIQLRHEELSSQRDEIQQQNVYLNKVYKEISQKNKFLTDGIHYAKRIQKALMPGRQYVNTLFPQNFIFDKPKEILSGDFYWATSTKVNNETRYIFTAADSTGHGIPGALMSIIGNNMLYESVIVFKSTKPSEILDNLQLMIKERLNQGGKHDSKDGMDMALISYNPDTRELEFAGARNPLLHVRDGVITEYKADRMSIGGRDHSRIKEGRKFTNHTIKIEQGDMIYMFSDGYLDQAGGNHGRKFMKKRFKQLISYIADLSLKDQEYQLDAIFEKWRGDYIQVDDVIVTGIRF